MISETMARTMFQGLSDWAALRQDRSGARRRHGSDWCSEDAKFEALQEDPQTVDYYPYSQQLRYLNDVEVRYAGDFDAIVPSVRRAIHDVDHNLPISHVTTLDEQVGRSIANQRLVAQLPCSFGLLALFLACIGIYGVMSYVVTRRTSEIGIRMRWGRVARVWLLAACCARS